MINNCQKRTYEAGREATVTQPRANRNLLVQILVQLKAHVIHKLTVYVTSFYTVLLTS